MKKPMSKRRAREFRDARLKRLYGDRKKRAERWAMIVRFPDHPEVHAVRVRRFLDKGARRLQFNPGDPSQFDDARKAWNKAFAGQGPVT
jgi:hypothetical protein